MGGGVRSVGLLPFSLCRYVAMGLRGLRGLRGCKFLLCGYEVCLYGDALQRGDTHSLRACNMLDEVYALTYDKEVTYAWLQQQVLCPFPVLVLPLCNEQQKLRVREMMPLG